MIEKEKMIPYVVSAKHNLDYLNTKPFGIETEIIDPFAQNAQGFLNLLNDLDGLSYGNKLLAMDKWVALDCGILPGAFVGFAVDASELDEGDKQKYGIEDYEGLVPVTEFCAIPSVEPGTWVGHTLASFFKKKGYGTMTEALGMEVYGSEKMVGVAQYNNSSIKVHTKFGELELIAAMTYAHSVPDMSFTFSVKNPGTEKLLQIMKEPLCTNENIEDADFLLDPNNLVEKMEMQENLEAGLAKYFIQSPGWIEKCGELYVPIKEKK